MGAATEVTIRDIDEQLAQISQVLATYRRGGDVSHVNVLAAYDAIDELLDWRLELAGGVRVVL